MATSSTESRALMPPHGPYFRGLLRKVILELLREDEARSLAERLGILGDDVYEELAGLRLRSTSTRFQALAEFFGVELPPKSVTLVISESEVVVPAYGLFDHQCVAASKVWSALRTEPRRVLLHMPTGSGKTRTAMTVVSRHLREKGPTIVTWLASSEELCEQAADEFKRAWTSLGNRSIEIYRCWGTSLPDLGTVSDGIFIGGFAKIYSQAIQHPPFLAMLGDATSLLVVDEAHQVIADSYRLVAEAIQARGLESGLLGLSATPGRTWADLDADEKLSDFFYQKKVGLTIAGFPNPVDYLIEEGYLARPRFRMMRHIPDTLASSDFEGLSQSLEVPREILEKLAQDEIRNLLIISEIKKLARRHSRIIVFGATVSHAILLGTVLRTQGLAAYSITSNTMGAERKRLIDWYREHSDEVRILCNYGVLTTGFDAPQTSCALIARPTQSLILFSQMVGRAIRGRRAGGNDEAEIVTIIDVGLEGFSSVANAFTHWDDVWTHHEVSV